MIEVNRLSALKELRDKLYDLIYVEECDTKSIAAITKQYRETLKEIEEIEGTENNNDGISAILESRKADGKSKSVRKSSSGM